MCPGQQGKAALSSITAHQAPRSVLSPDLLKTKPFECGLCCNSLSHNLMCGGKIQHQSCCFKGAQPSQRSPPDVIIVAHLQALYKSSNLSSNIGLTGFINLLSNNRTCVFLRLHKGYCNCCGICRALAIFVCVCLNGLQKSYCLFNSLFFKDWSLFTSGNFTVQLFWDAGSCVGPLREPINAALRQHLDFIGFTLAESLVVKTQTS